MPNELPFRPWWWKPEYPGRHRGRYQHGPKLGDPIPLGEIVVTASWFGYVSGE